MTSKTLLRAGLAGCAALAIAAFMTDAALAQAAAPAAAPAIVANKGDNAWMLVSSVLVLLMTIPGLALFYGGLVRTKNMLSLLTQVFAIVSLACILWVFFGYSLAFTNGGGLNESFTVRKISYGEGVERVFPVHSPMIDSIKLVRRGKVRRAKLYYLRDRRGKSARIAERVDNKPKASAQ